MAKQPLFYDENSTTKSIYFGWWYYFAKIQKGGRNMSKSTMSVQELSSQMGISLPKAYELVKQPGFPVLHIGTRILIPVDAFNKWLNNQAEQK